MPPLTDIIALPEAGRLKAPQTLPYAAVKVELLKRDLAGTNGGWIDVRKVTFEVRGHKPDVVTACAAIRTAFNRNITLVFPSGARFMTWLPVGDCKLTEDPATKDGHDIWLGTIEAHCYSVRQD